MRLEVKTGVTGDSPAQLSMTMRLFLDPWEYDYINSKNLWHFGLMNEGVVFDEEISVRMMVESIISFYGPDQYGTTLMRDREAATRRCIEEFSEFLQKVAT